MVTMMREDEDLGSGFGSGDGRKGANCRTRLTILQGVKEEGVGRDAQVFSLGS